AFVFNRTRRIGGNHDLGTRRDERCRGAVADVGLCGHLVTRTTRVRPVDMGLVVQPRGVEIAHRGEHPLIDRDASAAHSSLTPAALITRAQRSASFFRKPVNSSGELACVIAPSAARRAPVCRLAREARTAAFSLPIAAAGVPLGATRPRPCVYSSKPGKPDSAMV